MLSPTKMYFDSFSFSLKKKEICGLKCLAKLNEMADEI